MSKENALKMLEALELWERAFSEAEPRPDEPRETDKFKTGFHALFERDGVMLYSIWVDGNRGAGYRVLGEELQENVITWYWAGTHRQYEAKLKNLR